LIVVCFNYLPYLNRNQEMTETYREYLTAYIKNNYIPKDALIENLPQDNEIDTSPSGENYADAIFIYDINSGLRYTLFNQIPLKREFNETQVRILKRLFDIIHEYYSFTNPNARLCIAAMQSWLSTKSRTFNASEYVKTLKMYNEEYDNAFPKLTGWKTCQGSESHYRGYPCSLWLLFHTLTVSEYVKTLKSHKFENLHEVIYTMRDYITNFFSCTDCAKHFGQMAATLEDEIIYPNSSVLWLWAAHNRANKRLAGDQTEDPAHPKVQFPTIQMCPNCYIDSKFDNASVLEFLVNRYTAENFADLSTSKPPTPTIPGEQRWPTIFLDRNDISLCLIIYVSVSFVLLTICFVLNFRKRTRDLRSMLLP
jgi:hypothetical protein